MKSTVLKRVGKFGGVRALQAGFTIIELVIVLGVIAILGAFSVPRVNEMLIANKSQTVGRELQQLIVRVRNGHQDVPAGGQPYTSVTTAEAANILRSTSFVVTGAGAAATVTHPLGTTTPTMAMAPGTLTTLGDSVLLTLSNVNRGACPALAAFLAKSIDTIQINGTNVKTATGTFNSTNAENACVDGDANTFIFQFH